MQIDVDRTYRLDDADGLNVSATSCGVDYGKSVIISTKFHFGVERCVIVLHTSSALHKEAVRQLAIEFGLIEKPKEA